jgi:hypothetical protein
MNEFEYQMYLSKLESIKGTKQPITKFIQGLYDKYLRGVYNTPIQTTAVVYKLISRAINYSSSKKPTTIEILRWHEDTPKFLLNAHSLVLSDKEWVELFEFPVKYKVNLTPRSIAELLEVDRRANLIIQTRPSTKPSLGVTLGSYDIKFLKDTPRINAVVSAVIEHYNPTSVLLSHHLSQDDVALRIGLDSIREFIEQITPILKDHNELINSSSTTE